MCPDFGEPEGGGEPRQGGLVPLLLHEASLPGLGGLPFGMHGGYTASIPGCRRTGVGGGLHGGEEVEAVLCQGEEELSGVD